MQIVKVNYRFHIYFPFIYAMFYSSPKLMTIRFEYFSQPTKLSDSEPESVLPVSVLVRKSSQIRVREEVRANEMSNHSRS